MNRLSSFEKMAVAKLPPNDVKGIIDVTDFFNEDLMDPELPQDFMYTQISRMFKEDLELKVMNKVVMYGEQEMSKVCVVSMDDDYIHVGPKEMDPPFYLPKEDFCSTDLMLTWFDRYRDGVREDLPDLPLPHPIIPENQYFRPEYDYFIENYANSLGSVIVDPSVGLLNSGIEIQACRCQDKSSLPSVEDIERLYNVEKQSEGDEEENKRESLVYFFPYRDLSGDTLKVMEGRNYIAMQFNPFHPMAIHFLEEYRWNKSLHVVKGTYRYRNKIRHFRFDINDQRYRIHSHIWLQIARGYKFSGFMEVFDMVGNFPFNDKMKFLTKDVYVEPLIIEPLASRGRLLIPETPYSYIGCGNYYERGVNKFAVCPYANFLLENKNLDVTWAIDISDLVEMQPGGMKVHDYFVPMNKKELQSEVFFLRFYDKNKYKVYERVRYMGMVEDELESSSYTEMHLFETSFRKYYVRDLEKYYSEFVEGEEEGRAYKFSFMPVKFYSFPRNSSGSLVIDFRTISLHDAVQMDMSTLHEYWPYLVPFSDYMVEDSDVIDYSRGKGPELIPFEWDDHERDINY